MIDLRLQLMGRFMWPDQVHMAKDIGLLSGV